MPPVGAHKGGELAAEIINAAPTGGSLPACKRAEFRSIEALHRFSSDIAKSGKLCQTAQSLFWLFCAQDQNPIVSARRPILRLELNSRFGGRLAEVLCASGRLFHSHRPLFSEADESYISCHSFP